MFSSKSSLFWSWTGLKFACTPDWKSDTVCFNSNTQQTTSIRYNRTLTLDCLRISNFVPHILTKTWTYRTFAESVHSLSKKSPRSLFSFYSALMETDVYKVLHPNCPTTCPLNHPSSLHLLQRNNISTTFRHLNSFLSFQINLNKKWTFHKDCPVAGHWNSETVCLKVQCLVLFCSWYTHPHWA